MLMNISRSRRNPTRGRLLAVGLLLLAAIGAAASAIAPAAAAEPAHKPPVAGPISWSVTPATAKAPDSRAMFSYGNLRPGTSISDHVAVLNRSPQSVAFSIYATDATGTVASGALTLLPANKRPTDVGAWVTFPRHFFSPMSVIIPGGKGIIEPFTLRVPRRATPGDHTGGMIAAIGVPHRNSAGQMVTLYQRIAVPIELRVTGKLHAALRVQSVSASFSNPVNPFGGGSASVTYTVANTGNVKLSGTQVVTVTGPFGAKSTIRPPVLPTVLPGDSITFTVPAHGGFYPAGSLDAHVSITPRWPANTVPLATPLLLASNSSSLFAVPWALIVLVVLLVGGGYGGWWTRRRRRRAHLDEVAAAAQQARIETERRLLGGNGKSASVAMPRSGTAQAGAPDAGNESG